MSPCIFVIGIFGLVVATLLLVQYVVAPRLNKQSAREAWKRIGNLRSNRSGDILTVAEVDFYLHMTKLNQPNCPDCGQGKLEVYAASGGKQFSSCSALCPVCDSRFEISDPIKGVRLTNRIKECSS